MTLLFLLLGCIAVADAARRLPATRKARVGARKARKTAEARARASRRVQTELWAGLGIIVVSLLVILGH
jgi:hypothetical protein